MTSKNKTFYVYVSCLSDIYFLDEYDEEITSSVCPMCGDSDDYIGSFDNVEDLATMTGIALERAMCVSLGTST